MAIIFLVAKKNGNNHKEQLMKDINNNNLVIIRFKFDEYNKVLEILNSLFFEDDFRECQYGRVEPVYNAGEIYFILLKPGEKLSNIITFLSSDFDLNDSKLGYICKMFNVRLQHYGRRFAGFRERMLNDGEGNEKGGNNPSNMYQIFLATAHPAKFSAAVDESLKSFSEFKFQEILPKEFVGLLEKEKRCIYKAGPKMVKRLLKAN
ncbi:20335_t:CDS:2 [Gigaspora margarita]|uniref:20335_t:CDS:1 n=1 Tax=Gigaspora margarita TaxID=4874 RepID=A0ABN7UHF7_GIGMA|nr:20335_t:CDS:2 [Gigaspora margarita]